MNSIQRIPYPETAPALWRPPASNHPLRDEHRYSEFVLESEGAGLFQYLRVLRRRALLLAVMSAVAGGIGFLTSLPQTPFYRARTTLEIAGTNWPGVVSSGDVGPAPEASLDDTYLQTQIKVFQSESLADRVVAKLNLENRAELLEQAGIIAALRQRAGVSPALEGSSHDRALREVVANLKVRPAGQTRVIEILYDCPNPQLAASIANAVVDEYILRFLELRGSTNQSTTEWLTVQLEELRGKLERSQMELQAYARDAGLVITSDKQSIAEDSLKQMRDELSKAALERMAKQSEKEVANLYPNESLPEVLENRVLQDYRIKLGDLQRQLADLSTSLTPTHYRVRHVQAEIAEVQALMNTERDNILKRIAGGFESARRREALLSDAYTQETKHFSELAERGIKYEMLKHEVDTNRQLFDAMLQKVKEARITSALRASNIRMLDRAKPPAAPYRPNKRASTAIGLLAGLSLGMLFVVASERSDRTLKSPGETALQLGVKELGCIPAARTDPDVGKARRPAVVPSIRRSPLDLELMRPIPELVIWQRKSSAMAESFRAVLASILCKHHKGDHPRVIVVTSPGPGEGKTSSVSNLAIALAEIHLRVVLIDGDMRRTRLHELFDVPNTWGLSNILSDQNLIEDCPIEALTRASQIPGVNLVPSGPSVLNTSSLLYSGRMEALLQRLRREFDVILIDTPPMMQCPDARVLGQHADGVVLVVRAGQTTLDMALAARRRLSEDMIPVIGAILNDWDPRSGVPPSTYPVNEFRG